MFGTACLVGFMIGSIFLTPLGDVYGRRMMNFVTTLVQSIGFFGITICLAVPGWANYWVLIFFTFILGLPTASLYNISMMVANEYTTQEGQKFYTFMGLFFDTFIMVLIGLEFAFIKSMLPGMYFCCALHVYMII